ncbi:MAG: repeat protein [Clostridiaceae bacterium]|jgi:hypothetical protein|nr:repeat protein [Clostridiaceae bacterium]
MKRVFIGLITLLIIISSTIGLNYAQTTTPDEEEIYIMYTENGMNGLINTEGDILLKPVYQDFGVDQINGMLAIKRGNKWGFIDKSFNEVIKPQFDEVNYFYCGWCPVRVGSLWGLIDTKGQWIIKPLYDFIEISVETKLAIICQKGKYGLIDGNGKVKINASYEKLSFLKDGMMAFVKNGKTGMINEKGVELIPAEYKGIYTSSYFPDKSKYSFSVQIEQEVPNGGGFYIRNKTGIIEKSGRINILDKNESYYFFSEDLGKATDEFFNTVGLVDKNLNTLVKPLYSQIEPYLKDEFIAVKYGRYHGTINKNGKEIIKPLYTSMKKVGENLLVCFGNLKGGKWGMIDKNGKTVVPIKYSNANTNGEFVCFEENGLWGVFDAKGNITIKPKFLTEPKLTENNILFVLKYGAGYLFNAGYFKINGESLTKSISDSIYPFENGEVFSAGMAPVKMNGKWGFINSNGELAIPCKFDYINGGFYKGVSWVTAPGKDGTLKMGLINKKGEYIFEPQFDGPHYNKIITAYNSKNG